MTDPSEPRAVPARGDPPGERYESLLEAVEAADGDALREALRELDLLDPDRPDSLGDRYEPTIPADERRALGQFYTPPGLVDLVMRLCVESPDDAVLDPACGGGAILAGAYDRLADLADGTDPAGRPRRADPLDRLYGVEVEAVPAALAAASLARRAGTADAGAANVAVADFFDAEPGATLESEIPADRPVRLPGRVDAVVGNPPYLRQEAIPDLDRVRDHLDRPGVDATLDERSDLYAYFLTHASEFLAEGGRLGFVTPSKWLGVGYGESLRAFVLDRFRVEAVVSFDDRVFADPLVPACVTVLRRCADPERRAAHVVPFVRVERWSAVDGLVERVEADRRPGSVEEGDGFRLVATRQGDLAPDEKWTRYLTAPAVYWKLRSHDGFRRLDDLATVRYGTKPGAVDFFFPEPADLPAELADSRWFRPAIKSIRDADRIRFAPADADKLVLDVHALVSSLLDGADSTVPGGEAGTPAPGHREAVRAAERGFAAAADGDARRLSEEEVRVTALLAERGHDALFEYVRSGVRAGYHDRPTCAARRVWFDLGELPEAPIVAGQFVWESAPYLYLPTPLPVSNALCYVDPADGVEPALLAAVLNAGVTRLFMEVHGRVEGGRALQLQVYEREALPVPDVRAFDPTDADEVTRRFEALLDAQEGEADDGDGDVDGDVDGGEGDGPVEVARRRLDEAVLGAVGLGDLAAEVADRAEETTRARVDGRR